MSPRLPRALATLAAAAALHSPAFAQSTFDPANVAGAPSQAPQGKIVLPAPVEPTPGQPVTDLGSALQLTTRLPSYLAQQAQERASESRVDQARAAFGPQLDGEVSYGYARDRFDVGLGQTVTRSGWTPGARATLSQILFSSGQLTAGVRSAQANREVQRQVRRSAENQALLNSVQAYVDVQRTRALVDIARENLTLLTEQSESSAARFEQRELTAVDNDQVRARLESSRADLASAEAASNSAQARFLQAIGAPPGDLAPAPPPLALMPPTLEEAQVIAGQESPVIIAAQARERASRAQLGGARGALGPVVSLEGSVDRNSQSPYSDSLMQTEARGAVTVRLPIYDSGARYARMEEAKATNDADARLIDQAYRDTKFDVQNTWERYAAGLRSIASLRDAAKAAESAYNGVTVQERAGLVTTMDVLILLRDLLLVRSQLVNVEADTQVARYALVAAMGRLEFDRLNVIAAKPSDAAKIHRVGPEYTLPVGPLVSGIESVASDSNRKPRNSRDDARSVRIPGTPAPVEQPAADAKISTPAGD